MDPQAARRRLVSTPAHHAASRHRGKQAMQDLLVSAMGHTAESIMVISTDGVVLYANQAFERTSGYTAAT